MILTRDRNRGDYEIHWYEPGRIKINDEIYNQSIIISSNQLILWPPKNLAELNPENFEIILNLTPDIVLLGTGEKMAFPKNRLLKSFYEKQIGVEVMATLAACRTFNVLMSEGRNVVAALLIK